MKHSVSIEDAVRGSFGSRRRPRPTTADQTRGAPERSAPAISLSDQVPGGGLIADGHGERLHLTRCRARIGSKAEKCVRRHGGGAWVTQDPVLHEVFAFLFICPSPVTVMGMFPNVPVNLIVPDRT